MNSSFKPLRVATLVEPIKLTSHDLIEESNFLDWTDLPNDICDGLSCKRIKTPEHHDGFLLKYETGSLTSPHVNPDEYVILNVKYGTITNLITNEQYSEGETMVINKDEMHQIYCDKEAYVYFVTTKSDSELERLT